MIPKDTSQDLRHELEEKYGESSRRGVAKRNASLQPTLTIRPSTPMRMMVNKDLVLRPVAAAIH